MAESTPVALAAAPLPSSAEIKRAEKFVRERFLHDGEDAAVALGTGTPRRRALDLALEELAQAAKHPSTAWRREFSLLLGLERLLSDEEPKLADGTVLSAHQVDALSGTLTALLAESQRTAENGNGKRGALVASPELLASAAILGPDDGEPAMPDGDEPPEPPASDGLEEDDEEEPEDDEEDDEDEDLGPVARAAPEEDEDEELDLDDELELDVE
ncbi:MAG TPA: hypothetical protein VGF15_05110, partial [Solirubrobacteraceae bacterium]